MSNIIVAVFTGLCVLAFYACATAIIIGLVFVIMYAMAHALTLLWVSAMIVMLLIVAYCIGS